MTDEQSAPEPGARLRVVVNPSSLLPVGEVALAHDAQWRATLSATRLVSVNWKQRRADARAAALASVGERLVAIHGELALFHAQETVQVFTEALDVARRAAACWQVDPMRPQGGRLRRQPFA